MATGETVGAEGERRHWDEGARPEELPALELSPAGVLEAVNRAIYVNYERADINRRYLRGELDGPEFVHIQPDDPELAKEFDHIMDTLDKVLPIDVEMGWRGFVYHTYLDRVVAEMDKGAGPEQGT